MTFLTCGASIDILTHQHTNVLIKAKNLLIISSQQSCERGEALLAKYKQEKGVLEADIGQLEQRRVVSANTLANIDKFPELASDNAIIEEMTQKLESLKSAYSEKKLNRSTEHSICIDKIVAKQRRKFEELVKGCKQVAAHSKTIETNEETSNNKLKELNHTRDFAWGFMTICICEDNKSCALDDPNVLTQGTLMDSFKEGVEQGPKVVIIHPNISNL